MPKFPTAASDGPKKITSYTAKLSDEQMELVRRHCVARSWEAFEVQYARFAYRGSKVNVTAYTSGKLVVAGKETEDFVTNFLEPEVLKEARFGYDGVVHPEWFEEHAGMDESGKGDFFGPVVTACVIAGREQVEAWMKAGVRDSKTLADSQILRLDKLIRETRGAVATTCFCGMDKYNELMSRPKANLNRLLAWQHSKSLGEALGRRRVPWGMLDQFSKQNLVATYFKDEAFELRQRTKAEEDPVVAAASIVARAEYVRIMRRLSDEFGGPLQKGASAKVKEQARTIIDRFGAPALRRFAKLHFRTAYEVVKEAGKLGELPLPEPKPAFQGW
ncbi:MAG TPA: ribonuclease HIII [Opitutaceae bacterium]